MDPQKIDRIFREKLHNIEAKPSVNAWDQVSSQINQQKRYPILWIAAAIIPLVFFGLYFVLPFEADNQFTNVDHPQQTKIPTFRWKIEQIQFTYASTNKVDKSIPLKSINPKSKVGNTIPSNASFDQPIIELEGNSLENTLIADAIETHESIVPAESLNKKKEKSPIKITYIASRQETQVATQMMEPDSTTTFKKLIAFADNFSPVEVLSDIKSAKDNLFDGGFKNKTNKNSL